MHVLAEAAACVEFKVQFDAVVEPYHYFILSYFS